MTILHHCNLAECTVTDTGKCMEGLDLDECPNYQGFESKLETAVSTLSAESFKQAVEPKQLDNVDTINLPDGLDFTPITASSITRARLTRIIVIAGDQDSGKTTLVTSLFDKFQEGPFAGYLFAGCRTLRGLERRCFPSRIESERVQPHTTRTIRGDGQSLLHLRLRAETLTRPAQDLLLSDISGEFFRDACDSTDGCKHLQVLRRADHLVLCIDGEKLANTSQRHEAYNTGKLLIQSALDAEMIGHFTFVDVLFTKRDLLSSSAMTYLDNISQRFRSEFAGRVGRLRFFEVAARPKVAGFSLAYGLDRVIPSWVEETPFYTLRPPKDLSDFVTSLAQTEFDKYALRRQAGIFP